MRRADRRAFLRTGMAAVAGLALAGAGLPRIALASSAAEIGPDEALRLLVEGNRRFAAGSSQRPNQSLERRAEVAKGQHPFAFVLGCYDSRVSLELVFDQGLGDIFSSRVAGNLIDDAVLGGIEFGVEEFHVPLVVILGHQRCGAVTATIDAVEHGATPPGSIGAVVEALRPAVELARSRPGDVLDNAVRANVELGVARVKASPVLSELIDTGAVKVVGGRYSLDTGDVELIA